MIQEEGTVIKRICSYCKESISISNDTVEEAIYYDKKTYHSKCFIALSQKRSEMKRADVSQKWSWVLENMRLIKINSNRYLYDALCKEALFEFIRDAYGISIIPTTVWQKIASVYAGSFKGMAKGIPPEHLLDMWKRKLNMLCAVADKNAAKGKKMSTDQRLTYDLTILVNKYDSYLKWMEKQKILSEETELENKEYFVGKSIGYAVQKNTFEEKEDISGLVDDIFK